MTTAVGTRPGLALGRVAAALAVASAGVHVLLLDGGSLGSLVMLAMAAVCLPCAWHLWRHPTGRVWATTALMDVGMLVLHLQMVGGDGPMAGMHDGPLVQVGLVLVAGQLALATLAALPRRR